MFEVRHPIFRPLGRRVAFTAAILGWAGFEAWKGDFLWALVFAAAGLYLLWSFFISFDPKDYEEKGNG